LKARTLNEKHSLEMGLIQAFMDMRTVGRLSAILRSTGHFNRKAFQMRIRQSTFYRLGFTESGRALTDRMT
jgi:hypothetical protein